MKLRRPRATGLAVALALAAGGAAVATTSAAGTDAAGQPAAHIAVAHHPTQAQVRTALLRYLSSGFHPGAELARTGVKPSSPDLRASSRGQSAVGSFNWSGYADTSSTPKAFSSVSATWLQPSTVCTPEQRLTAFWVGLDGFNNNTVEQDGTLAYCFEGQATYFTWWEMFPGASVTIGTTVRPGDQITASVSVSGTNYTLSVTDHNNSANSFSTVQSCTTCTNESVEWIAERPAFPIGVTPLSFFPGWNVTNATQTSGGSTGGIGDGPDPTSITMIDATQTYPLDSITGLRPGPGGFGAAWLNSY